MLYARGVDLVRIEVVPDDREDIARSVAALSERVGPDGFVFTSGGIGVRRIASCAAFCAASIPADALACVRAYSHACSRRMMM